MGRYMRGQIDEDIGLATLAGKTAVATVFGSTVTETTRISSVEITATLSGFTEGVDNTGPVMCGIAHSDYTTAEIEAWIEATASWSEGDLVAQEVSNRRIRRLGIFPSAVVALGSAPLNDGRPIKEKLNWRLSTGQSLRSWAYNMGTVAFATTDPNMHFQGHANLWKTG